MYTGNPHQDRNPFKSFTGGFQQGWEDRRPPFHGGGAIPMPKDTMEREGTPAIPMPEATWQKPAPWQGDAPWQTDTNPNWISKEPLEHYRRKAEEGNVFDKMGFGIKNWMHDNMPLTNTKWDATNSTQGRLSPYGPLAELTQEQMDFMGSPYNTPAFGVSKEDLWNRTKGMEKKGFFGWGAQEPTTQQEFNDYYNQLEQGESGNWLAMNRGLDNWGAGAANTLGYDGTFRQEGFGDPNAINMWGGYYVPDYNYDTYDDKVLDPGFGDHAIGPLYFG